MRRGTATTITITIVVATIAGIAATATTATAFAGPLVEFFTAATTTRAARTFVLALRTAAATRLLHAAGAAGVLALMDRARLRFGRAGTVARSECDFELVELVPLGVGTVAIRDRQQFLQTCPR